MYGYNESLIIYRGKTQDSLYAEVTAYLHKGEGNFRCSFRQVDSRHVLADSGRLTEATAVLLHDEQKLQGLRRAEIQEHFLARR